MSPIIRVIDFEGGGQEPPADIVEYGWCDVARTDQGWDIGTPRSGLYGLTRPMEPGARAVHHIRPHELEGLPLFDPGRASADAIDAGAIIFAAHCWDLYEGKWLSGQVLGEGLRPLCTWKAALRVWPDAPSFGNGALRYWLEDQGLIAPTWELTQPAHRAAPDAYVTAHILVAMLRHFTAREMCAWTKEPALSPTCPIGEGQGWRGKKWSELETKALIWMVEKPVEADVVWNAQRELERRRAAP